MLRICFISFLLILTFITQAQSVIDVQHYKYEIELSDKSDTIKGKATITMQFTEGASQFWINLTSRNWRGNGMSVYEVRENGDMLNSSQKYDTLFVHLKHEAQKGETRKIEVYYKGIPADGLIISKNHFGDRVFFADNWPNRARNWIPCKDEPDDKASFEFAVTAPGKYKVISNGRLVEKKGLTGSRKLTHWVEDVSLPTKVMVIGVAKFAVKQFDDSPPDIPVSAWTYPQDSLVGFQKYSVAPAALKFFSDYIGPYPYNKLANVQSKTIFGGMENASAIFYFEYSAEQGKPMDDIVAHEIAHQWFGDMVSEKKFSHLWLSEGFATFFENMFLGHKYGKDSMTHKFAVDRKRVIEFAAESNRPVVDSLSMLMSLLNSNSYQKGGWVLRMLQHGMGDTVFQTFIRTYYNQYKGKNADTNDLEAVAESVSGKNWKQFFKQWLYSPGMPVLDIQWKYDQGASSVAITVAQVQQQDAFEFPLQVLLQGDSPQVIELNVSKRSETFTLAVTQAVNGVIADPNTALLFDGRVQRIN